MTEKWTRADGLQVRAVMERLNLCGCGTDAHWEIVLNLLERAADHDKNGSFYKFQPGNDTEHECDSWVEFGAKVLDSWELIEHGSGIGYAWLTEDGTLLLRFLREFGIEGYNMCSSDEDQKHQHPCWATEYSWTETPELDDAFSTWEKLVSIPSSQQPG